MGWQARLGAIWQAGCGKAGVDGSGRARLGGAWERQARIVWAGLFQFGRGLARQAMQVLFRHGRSGESGTGEAGEVRSG